MQTISTKERVLFICTGNSARSIMGEAILRQRAGDRFEVLSAGTAPKGVNPLTLKVLEEIDVNTQGLQSKDVMEYLGRVNVSHAILVCDHAQQNCPSVFPFTRHRHFWPFPDPAAAEGAEAQRLQSFRSVRDQIAARIDAWLAE